MQSITLPDKINLFERIPNDVALYLISKGLCQQDPTISGREYGPIPNVQFDGQHLTKIKKENSESEAGFYLYRTDGSLIFQLYNFSLEIQKISGSNVLIRKGLIKHIFPPISFKTLDEEIENEWFYREFS